MDQLKTCVRCARTMPLNAFYKRKASKDGHMARCRPCSLGRDPDNPPQHNRNRKSRNRDANGKVCTRCDTYKLWDEFNRNASARDGRQHYCRLCSQRLAKESELRNAEARALRRAERLARPLPDPTVMKTCKRCGEARPALEFYAYATTPDGRHSWCKPCCRKYARERRATPKGKAYQREQNLKRLLDPAKVAKRNADMKTRWLRLYGLTPEAYDALLDAQGDRCGICGEPGTPWPDRNLAVDHCHDSDVVRGLLCRHCNTGLGAFRDAPARLLKAIEYLANPPARSAQTA